MLHSQVHGACQPFGNESCGLPSPNPSLPITRVHSLTNAPAPSSSMARVHSSMNMPVHATSHRMKQKEPCEFKLADFVCYLTVLCSFTDPNLKQNQKRHDVALLPGQKNLKNLNIIFFPQSCPHGAMHFRMSTETLPYCQQILHMQAISSLTLLGLLACRMSRRR